MSLDSGRIQHLINTITTQFKYRTETESRKRGHDYGISLNVDVDKNNLLWLSFVKGDECHNVTLPLPFERDGVLLVQQNVSRSVCSFWLEKEQKEIDYLAAMFLIILGVPSGIIPDKFIKATPHLQQMIYGFENCNASIIAYRFQKAINEVINKLPLHETMMNSYIMNNRLMIIDPAFDELTSPTERLEYQTNKARKYFDRGWTSIGLSDGSLADKNYILKKDLRYFSPFGIHYHNPQRNLYSTLGMKGDELPLIRSQSMQDLIDVGITRKGWNLFTAFVDIPDVFEDQIMVDESLVTKFVEYSQRFKVFGTIKVKERQCIETGDILGIAPDQEPIVFKTLCDSARIEKIVKSVVSVGGVATKVYNVVVRHKRHFCDGLKITNLHGNKGVVRVAKLGHATCPRTGELRKIHVIVGGKTIGKRRNFGQIIEALTSCVIEADHKIDGWVAARMKLGHEVLTKYKPTVVKDDWSQPISEITEGLKKRGFNEDGTWDCNTYAGKVKAVCGTVFWGCIHTPQDQIWKHNATINRNGKEVRTAGLKLSHVEFRAIETRFGVDNPIKDEIMSYAQGTDNIEDMLNMLRSKVGEYPRGLPLLDINSVKPMDQTTGTIVPGQCIGGTVVDEFFHPDGFLFKLPIPLQTLMDDNGDIIHEGSNLVYDQLSPDKQSKITKEYNCDRLYFPGGTLRKCWRHTTGKYGLSEIGVLINNVVTMSHKLVANFGDSVHHRLYYNSLFAYFTSLAKMMGSKRGEISVHGMAIRYPFSVKATATLTNNLPKNTVEIHKSMAKILRVNNGDIVLSERFPCLGFMSIRPQKVHITNDPMCKYVIRVSGNSLVSQNLDFDGDVLFLAAFHTPAAKKALLKEWSNPNKTCYREIKQLNERKGAPHIKEYTLPDFDIVPFANITNDEHATIVEKNTGVKAQTGPVIALTYNIMRIVENSDMAKDQKMKVAIEMFLEKAAQSVFEQKHGGKSLYEIVIDGVCTANVEMLVEVGFKRGTTEKLCQLITDRANALGIFDLLKHYERVKSKGGSNVVSTIVRSQNLIYYASRSNLEGIALLEVLKSPAVDIPSHMFKWIMSGKTKCVNTILDEVLVSDKIKMIKNKEYQTACISLCNIIDDTFKKKVHPFIQWSRQLQRSVRSNMEESYAKADTCGCRRQDSNCWGQI